ncbi:GIY-YIG nuclease family protein [Dyadobacter frigoris]|uniref:GIY-YIG nuclease family protein n=1 Tax=Dyadobacter frigoris TaxID=2576211 RepID=A0A4U6D5K7_9BACT|nr:GIY-YIG nuclease family protein [Dyadobacter frigoris]TKT92639.1 GIY-YIG nuclease family protein [Dyadobacter frigoris]
MNHTLGKSIKLFLVDGSSHGVLTLEVMNWTGHILMGPRTKITEIIQRPEMKKTGIYFLTGPDPDGLERLAVYVGESDNVGHRLLQHNKDEGKGFWERACVITSKDQNLTKAHIRYLEARFISIIQTTGAANLFNYTSPKNDGLPEADISDMEYFISQVRLVLPVLGLDFLRDKPKITKTVETPLNLPATELSVPVNPESIRQESNENPIFEIVSTVNNLKASAKQVDGDFVVLAGSESKAVWGNNSAHNYRKLFETLIAEGKIRVDGGSGKGVFQEDVAFASPSAAAACVFARAANGRKEWLVQGTKKNYHEWQNDQLRLAESELSLNGLVS